MGDNEVAEAPFTPDFRRQPPSKQAQSFWQLALAFCHLENLLKFPARQRLH
jgi:hypothetical protein